MADITSLSIIEGEINRLKQQSQQGALGLEDIKKLEILIKSRALLLGEPTEIKSTQPVAEELTEEQILKILTSKPEVTKKKRTRKKE